MAVHRIDDLAAERHAERGLKSEQGLDLAQVQGSIAHHPIGGAADAAFQPGGVAAGHGFQRGLYCAATDARQRLGDEGVEDLIDPAAVDHDQRVRVTVVRHQQGDAAVGGAFFPACLDVVGELGRAAWLQVERQAV